CARRLMGAWFELEAPPPKGPTWRIVELPTMWLNAMRPALSLQSIGWDDPFRTPEERQCARELVGAWFELSAPLPKGLTWHFEESPALWPGAMLPAPTVEGIDRQVSNDN